MSTVPTNSTFRQQQKMLVQATFKKGYINAVNINARTVDVYYAENPQTIIRGIPVADNVTLTASLVGRRCRVDVFDETNPNDAVLAFTY